MSGNREKGNQFRELIVSVNTGHCGAVAFYNETLFFSLFFLIDEQPHFPSRLHRAGQGQRSTGRSMRRLICIIGMNPEGFSYSV